MVRPSCSQNRSTSCLRSWLSKRLPRVDNVPTPPAPTPAVGIVSATAGAAEADDVLLKTEGTLAAFGSCRLFVRGLSLETTSSEQYSVVDAYVITDRKSSRGCVRRLLRRCNQRRRRHRLDERCRTQGENYLRPARVVRVRPGADVRTGTRAHVRACFVEASRSHAVLPRALDGLHRCKCSDSGGG